MNRFINRPLMYLKWFETFEMATIENLTHSHIREMKHGNRIVIKNRFHLCWTNTVSLAYTNIILINIVSQPSTSETMKIKIIRFFPVNSFFFH